MDDEEAMDETERGESAGLLACDVSRDSTGDAAVTGGVADGVRGRRVRVTEEVGEAEAAGLVAALADSGRAAAGAVRTEDDGVAADVMAAALLAGDASRLGVMDDATCVEVAAIDVGLRSVLTAGVAGKASLDAAGLAAEEVEEAVEMLGAVVVVVAGVVGLRVARLLTAILDGGISGMVDQRRVTSRSKPHTVDESV